jgi:hypothetical protein
LKLVAPTLLLRVVAVERQGARVDQAVKVVQVE